MSEDSKILVQEEITLDSRRAYIKVKKMPRYDYHGTNVLYYEYGVSVNIEVEDGTVFKHRKVAFEKDIGGSRIRRWFRSRMMGRNTARSLQDFILDTTEEAVDEMYDEINRQNEQESEQMLETMTAEATVASLQD